MVATAKAVELSVAVHPNEVSPMWLVPTPQKNMAGAPSAKEIKGRLHRTKAHEPAAAQGRLTGSCWEAWSSQGGAFSHQLVYAPSKGCRIETLTTRRGMPLGIAVLLLSPW